MAAITVPCFCPHRGRSSLPLPSTVSDSSMPRDPHAWVSGSAAARTHSAADRRHAPECLRDKSRRRHPSGCRPIQTDTPLRSVGRIVRLNNAFRHRSSALRWQCKFAEIGSRSTWLSVYNPTGNDSIPATRPAWSQSPLRPHCTCWASGRFQSGADLRMSGPENMCPTGCGRLRPSNQGAKSGPLDAMQASMEGTGDPRYRRAAPKRTTRAGLTTCRSPLVQPNTRCYSRGHLIEERRHHLGGRVLNARWRQVAHLCHPQGPAFGIAFRPVQHGQRPSTLLRLLAPFPDDELMAYRVPQWVGRRDVDDPKPIERAA